MPRNISITFFRTNNIISVCPREDILVLPDPRVRQLISSIAFELCIRAVPSRVVLFLPPSPPPPSSVNQMRFWALIVKELLRAIHCKNFLLTFIRTYVEFLHTGYRKVASALLSRRLHIFPESCFGARLRPGCLSYITSKCDLYKRKPDVLLR